MHKIAETKRLILRELMPSDAESFYDLNADPAVLRYTGDQAFASIEEAKTFLLNYEDYRKNGFGRWAVMHKDKDMFIGWCGLKLNEEKQIDLGFRFFQRFWGNGFATEAAMASLAFGFNSLDLDEIVGRASIDNLASIRVLEKIGMHYWKTESCEGIHNARYYRISRKAKI